MRLLESASILKRNLVLNQSVRSRKIILSAAHSFVAKFFGIATSFYLVSLSIAYINTSSYGVWLTISSIITWISLFDIGLTSSLRNKVTEAIAHNDWHTAQKYTSTTYALLLVIVTPLWLAFFLSLKFLNWNVIFNSSMPNEYLGNVALCVFTSFCIQFALKPIVSILTADQKHFLANLIYLIVNIVSIVCLIVFKSLFFGSLFWISFLFGFAPCLVLIGISLILFRRTYRMFRPSIATVDFSCYKQLLGLGSKFFVIQLAGLIIFSSNNVIISQLLGNDQVTYYNIAFRYFSVITIGYSLINAPFWTAYTDAYAVKDWEWIKKVTRKANQFCTVLLVVTLLMLTVSTWVYKIWINESIKIPFSLSALMALNVALTIYGSTYTSFINGTGKLRLQASLCLFVCLCHAPIGYLLIKVLGLGLNGLIILSNIWALVSLVLWATQYKKIMERSTLYIWN